MSRKEDLERDRAQLDRLIATCNSEVWRTIEKMAQGYMHACEHAVMRMNHGNFEQDALDAAFTRGEYKVWSRLATIRESAPAELAEIDRSLAALRKEGPDAQDV